MKPDVRISEAEWEVMEILWGEAPLSALAVAKRLAATHDWKHQTVRTMLARLVNKGALTYRAEGNRHYYQPALTRESCVQQEGYSFLRRVFGGATPELVAHFVQNERLTAKQIEELRTLIDDQGRKRRGGK